MVKFIKGSIETSLKNWKTLILFVIGYKIFSYSIIYSITSDLLSMILKITGESYLSAENLYLIFINPFALLLSIIMLILIVFFVFIELIGLVIYSEAGWQGEKISILELLKGIAFHFKKILKRDNFLLIAFFILISI